MAGTSGASTDLTHGNEDARRMKCEDKFDLISCLPDCLIQHILSLLPSTKDSIRTSILSKRWLNQWTRVLVLIFKCPDGMSIEHFSNFIDKSLNLYNCPKINKFVISLLSVSDLSTELRVKLRRWALFAATRGVKELVLDVDIDDDARRWEYWCPPELVLKNDFLVKLKMCRCAFVPEKRDVNWASLKALHIGTAYFLKHGIGNILSGCPVIEHLELHNCYGLNRLSIASKSLKSFSLFNTCCYDIEISCPNLQKLKLLCQKMWFTCVKLKDLLPSVSATLDFQFGNWDWSDDDQLKCVTELLLQVKHLHNLKLGPWFFGILATAKGESSLLLNNRCLTVIDSTLVAVHPAIAISFLSCSLLEKLVIHLSCPEKIQRQNLMQKERKFWELDGSITDRVVSHLKIIEVVGLQQLYSHGSCNDLLKFLEFVLKNARMLEKIVLLEVEEQGLIFVSEVCRKLSCIQKASPHVIIKVACLPMVDLRFDSDWDRIEF